MKDKLKQLKFPVNIMKEIPMGVTVDSDRLKGLVDAANEQDLREKMCDLKERWE